MIFYDLLEVQIDQSCSDHRVPVVRRVVESLSQRVQQQVGAGRGDSSEHSDPVPLKSVTSRTRTAPHREQPLQGSYYVTGAHSYVSVPSRATGSVTAAAALPASLSHSQLHGLHVAFLWLRRIDCENPAPVS